MHVTRDSPKFIFGWVITLITGLIAHFPVEAKVENAVRDYADFTLRLEESFPQSDRLKVVKKWTEERAAEPSRRNSQDLLKSTNIILRLPALYDPDGRERSQTLAILKNLAESSSIQNLQILIPGTLPTDKPHVTALLERLQGRKVSVVWHAPLRSPTNLRREPNFYPKILDIRQSSSFRNDPTGDWIMGLADLPKMRNQLRSFAADLVVDDRIVVWPTPTLGFREFEPIQADELRHWFREIVRLRVKTIIIPVEFDQTSVAPRGIDWYTRDLNTRGLFRTDATPKPAFLQLLKLLAGTR